MVAWVGFCTFKREHLIAQMAPPDGSNQDTPTCRSWEGSQLGSNTTTRLADVRFRPTPPAAVESSSTKTLGLGGGRLSHQGG
jgi:hypothetical protein